MLAAKQGLCLALRKVGPGKPGIVKCGGHFSLTELFPCCILMLLSKKEGGAAMSIGPSRPLALEKPETIDLKQAARYFGQRGEPDAAPHAVWLESDVDSLTEAGLLQWEDVYRHLTGCDRAILLAVTLGPGVDAQIRRAGVGDIAAGVASDALGSALAEQMADAAEAELRNAAAGQGRYLTGRYSPGYGDWPITVQPLVAAALDTARRAGLCVTDTNLMTPRKSVTALLGVSEHPVKGHLAGCGHCVLRTRCEYRKRGITCASE